MNHQIVDAINKAYEDEVSRLFALLCAGHESEGLADFAQGMARAWKAKDMAINEGKRLANEVDCIASSRDMVWMGGQWVTVTPTKAD